MTKRRQTIHICVVELLHEELCYICDDCNAVLGEGSFVVGGTFNQSRFFIEHMPSLTCCGKEWHVPLLFKDKLSAVQKRDEIVAQVKTADDFHRLLIQDVTEDMEKVTTN